MKNSRLKAAQLIVSLVTMLFTASTISAQTSVCDVRDKAGIPVGCGCNVIDLYCNSTPSDLVTTEGVTCRGCLAAGPTHSEGWEKAGTAACTNFSKEMVIEFPVAVADVDVPMQGARTLTDNRGVVHHTDGSGSVVRFEGPGITRITLSDPIEFDYYGDGSPCGPGCWDMWVSNVSWGTEAAFYQCNCNRPTFARPASQSAFSPDWNGNGIPDWRMDVDVSDDDGLVLKNIRLENRYMAEQISVPYYSLETNSINPAQRGELKPDSGDPSMASRLVNYDVWNDDEKLVVEATYVIGQIPAGSTNCLEIIQRYEFYKSVSGDKCEPSGTLPCARWKPIVSYKFRGPAGEFHGINIAQRQHRTVDNNSYNSVGLFRDYDEVGPQILLDYFSAKCNPLPHEWTAQIVKGGKDAQVWDNVHQTYKGRVDEPYVSVYSFEQQKWLFVNPGCPECVHSHWRWGAITGGEGNGSLLGIPPGSTQDLDFGIVLLSRRRGRPDGLP